MLKLARNDLVYPELSYEIIGCAFDTHNELGGGHHEKHYERALSEAFNGRGIKYRRQVYYPLTFRGKVIGKSFFDFLVENKIIVEIKKGERYSKKNIDQILQYLESSKLPLAILINFGTDGVKFKRIVNFKYS